MSAVKIRSLIDLLNKANKAYYYGESEMMSNKEYDDLYDQLKRLEDESGIIYSDSPTQNLGDYVYSSLPKLKHESPMLSLDKTKDREVLKKWLWNKEGVLSWKLDGLTVVLTYQDGKLTKAVTRGNGLIGEEITENAKFFLNVPLSIPFKGKLTVRGEAVISYSDFKEINDAEQGRFKNPRNLASGSVRALDTNQVKKRKVQVIIFEVIQGSEENLVTDKFTWISHLGFKPVDYEVVNADNILQKIQDFENRITSNNIPSDGLVLTFNDSAYGRSLGMTGKFPKHSMAFKWQDEVEETVLRLVEWNTSRTGLINPVAVFDPVYLEGTEVSRATLNNVSFIKDLHLGIGDTIEVYKANMIIPQVLSNKTRSDNLIIPDECPTCGAATEIVTLNGTQTLRCTNLDCPAKFLNKLIHFCSRDAMDIQGLSKKTLEFLIDKGWVSSLIDLYSLQAKEVQWSMIRGYSTVSVRKILAAIESSKHTESNRFLYALGIPKIGKHQSKALIQVYGSWNNFVDHREEDFSQIPGIGDCLNDNIHKWFNDLYEQEHIKELSEMMIFEDMDVSAKGKFEGKTFCITGKLSRNRSELVDYIEKNGGHVSGSVSKNTDYLINNDKGSSSSKNRKAIELGISIITENDFDSL
ncbi:MAG: NAD-dependent DNA ligase LigA [Ruminococcus sp.]